MDEGKSSWIATLIALPVGILTATTSSLFLDISNMIDIMIGAGGFTVTYIPSQNYLFNKQLNEYGLVKSEYQYIREQLKDARTKVNRLKKSYINVRSLKDAKLVFDINRLVNTIHDTVEDDPKQFFGVQQFYHSHLDSAVNTVEHYLHLYKMPGKSRDERMKLHEARITLLEIKRSLESDVSTMNKSGYQALELEKDVVKVRRERSIKQLDNTLHKQEVNLDKVKTKEKQKVDEYEQN